MRGDTVLFRPLGVMPERSRTGHKGSTPASLNTPFYCDPYSSLSLCTSQSLSRMRISVQDGPDHEGRRNTSGISVGYACDWDDGFTFLPRAYGYLNARIGASMRGTEQMRRTFSSWGDVISLLRSEARLTGGPGTRRTLRKNVGRLDQWYTLGDDVDHRFLIPDRHYTLAIHRRTRMASFRVASVFRGEAATVMSIVPVDWEPVATEWVGVDLDTFEHAPDDDEGLCAAATDVQVWLERHPLFSGRVACVRTSKHGVQFVAQLAEQHDARGFYAAPRNRAILAELDSVALASVRARGWGGGHIDASVHTATQLMRRPGPRIDKSGEPFISRLVWAT